MKIGTLLTAAIVSLSTVGGGLAVYVAVTKYQTMDRITGGAGAGSRSSRAVSDIPRLPQPRARLCTNILYGPATVDPALLAEQDKLRKQTDGARDRMNALRKEVAGPVRRRRHASQQHRRASIRNSPRCASHRQGARGPAEARKDAAKKIVADNAVLNNGVVRRCSTSRSAAWRSSTAMPIARPATPTSP
jgi:hypothetical protein